MTAGLRVLVIEDEAPIALMIEDMLADMGCVVAGSAASVPQALGCVETLAFDFALLDLNLGNADASPVAEALLRRDTPFAFASGYGRRGVPAHLQGPPVIQKPFTATQLASLLADAAAARPAPAAP